MEQNSGLHTVAVLGASPKPERYSNKAVRLLVEHDYHVIPVHPAAEKIEGLPVSKNLADIRQKIDTLTIYLAKELSGPMADHIIRLRPGRVIFNPGTENSELQQRLTEAGIEVEEACTLVLLNTGQF